MLEAAIYLFAGLILGAGAWKRHRRSRTDGTHMAAYRAEHPIRFWYFLLLLGIGGSVCIAYGCLVLLHITPVGGQLTLNNSRVQSGRERPGCFSRVSA